MGRYAGNIPGISQQQQLESGRPDYRLLANLLYQITIWAESNMSYQSLGGNTATGTSSSNPHLSHSVLSTPFLYWHWLQHQHALAPSSDVTLPAGVWVEGLASRLQRGDPRFRTSLHIRPI